jgi:hypothetical protein
MEISDIVTIALVGIFALAAVRMYLNMVLHKERMKNDIEMKKYQKWQKSHNQGTSETSGNEEIQPWVGNLVKSFGIDPAVLLEDEMPDELKMFLPLAKGYFQAQGGLEGIAKKAQEAQAQGGGAGPSGKWETF